MAVFAVIALDPTRIHPLGDSIQEHYPNRYILVSPGHWLISDNVGTAKAVSERVGIAAGNFGGAVVYNVTGYFGRAPTPVWEWLAAHSGALGGL